MRVLKRLVSAILCIAIMLSISACSVPFLNKKDSDVTPTEKPEKIDTNYKAETKVSYSSGSDSNWSYGNQRKEFPRDEACYVRIGSTMIAEKNKGVGTEIVITYKFSGAKNCNIELSDGIATQKDSGDSDTVIFTRIITAEKEKKVTESVVIFQYMPGSEAENVKLEVSYDEHVPAQYDVLNTIYFS